MNEYPGPDDREPPVLPEPIDPPINPPPFPLMPPEPPVLPTPPVPPPPIPWTPPPMYGGYMTVPLPPKVPKPRRAEERGKSAWVLLCCGLALAASMIVGAVALSVLDVHTDRAENGTVRFWLGPEPPVVITPPPPVLTPTPVASETPAVPAPGEGMRAEDIYAKAAPGVVGILSSMYRNGATGTGMILREDGYILTNHHVVDEARSITVVLSDGTQMEARVIGTDYLSDIAVLKVNQTGLPCVELGSSDGMVTGAKCYAIGNPLGMTLQNTFTDGMISAINRDIVISDAARGEIMMTVLQTNCAVNPGNSGGPLLNHQGQVIGIVSSKIMGDFSSNVEGLGFAIPVDTAIPIINSLIEHGYVKGRPIIGISPATTQLDERTAEDLDLPMGVVIGEVSPGSDAHRKDIRIGDIVTHVNGQSVSSPADINRIKNRFLAGDTITLTIYRKGVVMDIDIILGDANE